MPVTLNAIELPDDTIWKDEFDWTGIAQSVETDITGGLVVEHTAGLSGRPVTLHLGWIDRSRLEALEILRDNSDQLVMELTLSDGRMLSVLFRHYEGTPIEVSPVIERPEYVCTDQFDIVLRLVSTG